MSYISFKDHKERSRPETPAGSRFKKTYQLEVDSETGHKGLKEIGEENIYEKIQEFAEETKIYNILKRFTNGDISALNQQAGGVYADIRNQPRDLIEAQATIQKIENTFNLLPPEVKREFGDNVNDFIRSGLDGSMAERIEGIKNQNAISKAVTEGAKGENAE